MKLFHRVTLGIPQWGVGYRKDWIARHVWADLWFWRFALIVPRLRRQAVAS